MAYFRCGGGLPTQQKTITATTSQQIVLPDEGNVLEKVTVNPQKHSTTATPTTRTAQYNLGEYHTVRYINTNSVPNNNTQTKTITTRGSSIDLGGATHNYRYVDTSGVPLGKFEDLPYTVLWSNPNPYVSFAAQTITISNFNYMNDGRLIDIYFLDNLSSWDGGGLGSPALNDYGHVIQTCWYSNHETCLISSRMGFYETCIREVEIGTYTSQNKTVFEFEDSFINNDHYGKGSTNNSTNIPLEIRLYN